MKAITYSEFGGPDVLTLQDVPKPDVKSSEVLIQIHAVSVNFGDLLARKFNTVTPKSFSMPALLWLPSRLFFGISKPRISTLGNEFSGVVQAVGENVTRFKPGDPVFGYRGQNMGAYAEYIAVPEKSMVALKPENLSFEEAAVIPYGGLTAYSLMQNANLQPGQKVLINGASGGIGSFAVQLAKHAGAEVTGVCGTPRLDYVKALGADHVIDYTREDFTENGQTYDLIFDVLNKSSFERVRSSLNPNGTYQLASFKTKQLWQMLKTRNSDKRVRCVLSTEKLDYFKQVKELAEAGVLSAGIGKRFTLETIQEAHRYAESGERTGMIAVTIAS